VVAIGHGAAGQFQIGALASLSASAPRSAVHGIALMAIGTARRSWCRSSGKL